MAEFSLARNSVVTVAATTVAITVNDAFDISFIITNCTAFKLQGSFDGGTTYSDIAGSGTVLGAAGVLTLGSPYVMSLTRCRASHIKPVFSGTNPVVTVVRRVTRVVPVNLPGTSAAVTLIDPVAGTA